MDKGRNIGSTSFVWENLWAKYRLLHWEVFSYGEDSSIPGGRTSVLVNIWGQLWDSGTQGGDLETSKFCHKNIYYQNADNKRPKDLGFGSG